MISPASFQTSPPEIKVTLLLTGGKFITHLKADAPLLHHLLEVIQAQARGEFVPPQLLQIPLQGERSLLSISTQQLIGLTTEPPVWAGQAPPPALVPASPPPSPPSLTATYTQINHFLTAIERERLLAYVAEQAANFVPTTTSVAAEYSDYRQSSFLRVFPEFAELVSRRIQAILPDVFRRLQITPFSLGEIEAQLTAHSNGHYYKLHNDNGSPDAVTRELTYVYYFYREPKGFSGGELLIYDTQILDGDRYDNCQPGPDYKIVTPTNNSIIFFPSYYLHEVLPVQCPSQQFLDSRFAINGWVRRQTS